MRARFHVSAHTLRATPVLTCCAPRSFLSFCVPFFAAGIPAETAVRVYRRYLKLEPSHVEEYIAYLKARGNWGEVARRLAEALNDETFRSLEGKSKHQVRGIRGCVIFMQRDVIGKWLMRAVCDCS